MSILLPVIYIAFISLGLPDSLLGSGWPSMRAEIGAPLSFAGILSAIISAGTIVSSLLSGRLTQRWGAGLVTAGSVMATAAALFGFSVSGSFGMLCLWAVPYGLGAGAVDAALNNYVAVHYASRHMIWLHGFWGVGTTIAPYIMAGSLSGGFGWQQGYRTVSVIQVVLAAVLFLTLPLWKRRRNAAEKGSLPLMKAPRIFSIPGAKDIFFAFFCYSAVESTAGLWASSYLVLYRGIPVGTAAQYASFFYIGITAGRFLLGFAADKIGDRNMIRIGIAVIAVGIGTILLPAGRGCLWGLVITGLGCAPIYPSVIHSTPANFGAEQSESIVGVQMASAYTGSTLMPPLFGWIAGQFGVGLYPVFLGVFAILMLWMTERLNRAAARRHSSGFQERGLK